MPMPTSTRYSRASSRPSRTERLEEGVADLGLSPALECLDPEVPHGQRLELAARREDLRAHPEGCGPGVDDTSQALDHGLLLGRGPLIASGLALGGRPRAG